MVRPADVLTQVTLFTKIGGPLTKRIRSRRTARSCPTAAPADGSGLG